MAGINRNWGHKSDAEFTGPVVAIYNKQHDLLVPTSVSRQKDADGLEVLQNARIYNFADGQLVFSVSFFLKP